MNNSTELIGRHVDDATAKKFKQWQIRTIFGSMIGYALYYIVRKNLTSNLQQIKDTAKFDKTFFYIELIQKPIYPQKVNEFY